MLGTLVRWNENKGFGFLQPVWAKKSDGIFVHRRNMPQEDGYDIGQLYEFDIESSKRNPGKKEAKRVDRVMSAPGKTRVESRAPPPGRRRGPPPRGGGPPGGGVFRVSPPSPEAFHRAPPPRRRQRLTPPEYQERRRRTPSPEFYQQRRRTDLRSPPPSRDYIGRDHRRADRSYGAPHRAPVRSPAPPIRRGGGVQSYERRPQHPRTRSPPPRAYSQLRTRSPPRSYYASETQPFEVSGGHERRREPRILGVRREHQELMHYESREMRAAPRERHRERDYYQSPPSTFSQRRR